MLLLIVVIFILETLRNIGLLFQKVTETSELWTRFKNLLKEQSMRCTIIEAVQDALKCIRVYQNVFKTSERRKRSPQSSWLG